MKSYLLTLFFILFILYVEHVFSLGCKSPSGTPVDWFILYKIPNNTKNVVDRKGDKFYYLDANSAEKKLRFYDADIRNTASNPLYHTLQQINDSESTLHAMYNDQPPSPFMTCSTGKKPSHGNGHLKGATAFNDKEGFWMISSIPRFPFPKKYDYGNGQLKYGQSVLCVSFERKFLDTIVETFSITNPCIHDGNITFISSTKLHKEFRFTSKGGTAFKYFGKSNKYTRDLYRDLVAVNLMDNLYVESWRYMEIGDNIVSDGFPSSCDPFKVKNVEKVGFDDGFLFNSTKDHSKWAVTENKSWICIGDLNRANSQCKRGGGTMCLEHKEVSDHYRKLIKSVENCDNGKRQKPVCSFEQDNPPKRPKKSCPSS